MDFKIRRASVEDAAGVAALDGDIFSDAWSEDGMKSAISRRENISLVCEDVDGSALAYCVLYVSADEGDLVRMAVNGSYRRLGIGRMLLERLIFDARAEGVRTIYLELRESNAAAERLYEKAGFSDNGMRKRFYRLPTEDARLMSLVIEQRI